MGLLPKIILCSDYEFISLSPTFHSTKHDFFKKIKKIDMRSAFHSIANRSRQAWKQDTFIVVDYFIRHPNTSVRPQHMKTLKTKY